MMNEKCAACIHCEVCGLIESEVAKDGACDFYEDGKRWIPIKTRPITEKEKEYFFADVEFIYDCELPDNGETVLITDKWGNVDKDTFYRDDGCYFEDYSGEDDVVAWMPLPEGYKAESEEKCE